MFGKDNSARYSQNRIDTQIGTGMRVKGNITFTGVLHIQGDALGDVLCDTDINGTINIGPSGNVAGRLTAPYIVVSGRVSGPTHSSESIEILEGACLVGDTFYETIEVHAGGVIEGSLTPKLSKEGEKLSKKRFIQASDSPAVEEYEMSLTSSAFSAVSRSWDRYGNGRTLGWAVTLLITLVTVMLVIRDPPLVKSPDPHVALKATPSTNESSAEQSAPVGSGELRNGTQGSAGNEAPLATISDLSTNSSIQTPPSDAPEKSLEKVVTVQGVNPRKPTDVFSVTSQEPSVLQKKKRQGSSEGKRIEIPEGVNIAIAIGKNEIVRVLEGQKSIMIFYQGRKVSPIIVESGAWISFVPQSPLGASEEE